MLRDLEELLLRIEDPASQEYMREAVRSYHGGAYRACVVIAVAAGMDDLRRKLQGLASSGGASPDVKNANAEVDKRYRDQDAYESTLLDHALKVDITTPAEDKKLRTLLQTRHLCGHPSGHVGSPEEARAVVAGIIELILSRPALLGMSAVQDILTRIEHAGFFPKKDSATIDSVMRTELKTVSPAVYPALVARLISAVPSSATEIEYALRSLISLPETRDEVWRRVNQLVENPVVTTRALFILAGDDGHGLAAAPALHRMRAVALVRRNLGHQQAQVAATAWHQAGILTDDEIDDLKAAVRDAALASSLDTVPAQVFDLPWANGATHYIERLVTSAASATWDVANAAIKAMQGLDESAAATVNNSQRVRYLLNVAENSAGVYPANAAKDLRRNGLGKRAPFADALLEQLTVDRKVVTTRDIRPLVEMLQKSQRDDVADAVIAALRAANKDGEDVHWLVIRWLEQKDDAEGTEESSGEPDGDQAPSGHSETS